MPGRMPEDILVLDLDLGIIGVVGDELKVVLTTLVVVVVVVFVIDKG